MRMRMIQIQQQEGRRKSDGPSRDKLRQIAHLKAKIADAKGWVKDLRTMNPSRQEIFNATNYVITLQDDLRRLTGSD